MQALNDEQQLERLEKKVDDSIADTKAEFRAVRAELGSVRAELGTVNRSLHAMWLTMILGFAAILLQHL
jgi:hypothetical protein